MSGTEQTETQSIDYRYDLNLYHQPCAEGAHKEFLLLSVTLTETFDSTGGNQRRQRQKVRFYVLKGKMVVPQDYKEPRVWYFERVTTVRDLIRYVEDGAKIFHGYNPKFEGRGRYENTNLYVLTLSPVPKAYQEILEIIRAKLRLGGTQHYVPENIVNRFLFTSEANQVKKEEGVYLLGPYRGLNLFQLLDELVQKAITTFIEQKKTHDYTQITKRLTDLLCLLLTKAIQFLKFSRRKDIAYGDIASDNFIVAVTDLQDMMDALFRSDDDSQLPRLLDVNVMITDCKHVQLNPPQQVKQQPSSVTESLEGRKFYRAPEEIRKNIMEEFVFQIRKLWVKESIAEEKLLHIYGCSIYSTGMVFLELYVFVCMLKTIILEKLATQEYPVHALLGRVREVIENLGQYSSDKKSVKTMIQRHFGSNGYRFFEKGSAVCCQELLPTQEELDVENPNEMVASEFISVVAKFLSSDPRERIALIDQGSRYEITKPPSSEPPIPIQPIESKRLSELSEIDRILNTNGMRYTRLEIGR